MLEQSGIGPQTDVVGVVKGADGNPTGTLQETPAMSLATSAMAVLVPAVSSDDTIPNDGAMARNVGITTVGDLGGGIRLDPGTLATWQRIVNDPAFPARITIYNVPSAPGSETDWSAVAAEVANLRITASSDKLRFPGVKVVIDGSIQGWTAVMNWPGSYTSEDQGILLTDPDQFVDQLRPFHEAEINIHTHCNGDAAVDLFIDAVDRLPIETSWLDHRHTVEHAQIVTGVQFRRMAGLGMCANIFSNHIWYWIWYWGDQHYELTPGPERANRMEASATANREGAPFSLHSDANVTPLGHLHTVVRGQPGNAQGAAARRVRKNLRVRRAVRGHHRCRLPDAPRRRTRRHRNRDMGRFHRAGGEPARCRTDGHQGYPRLGHGRGRRQVRGDARVGRGRDQTVPTTPTAFGGHAGTGITPARSGRMAVGGRRSRAGRSRPTSGRLPIHLASRWAQEASTTPRAMWSPPATRRPLPSGRPAGPCPKRAHEDGQRANRRGRRQ